MAASRSQEIPADKGQSCCIWYPNCNSPLCPLDPLINKRYSPVLEPLCYWYLKARKGMNPDDIPLVVASNLPNYVLRLSELREKAREQGKSTRYEAQI